MSRTAILCQTCDRPNGEGGCLAEQAIARYNAAWHRMDIAHGATMAGPAGVTALQELYVAMRAAEQDCNAHKVSWRDVALELRADVAAWQAASMIEMDPPAPANLSQLLQDMGDEADRLRREVAELQLDIRTAREESSPFEGG